MSNVIYKLEIKIWMINLWDFSTRAKEIRILIKFHCSREIYQPLRILTFNKKKINLFGNTEVINNIYTCKICILIIRCQKNETSYLYHRWILSTPLGTLSHNLLLPYHISPVLHSVCYIFAHSFYHILHEDRL